MNDKSKPASSQKLHERARVTRLACVQALFQIEATGNSIENIQGEFITHRFAARDYPCLPIEDLFRGILRTFNRSLTQFDTLLQEHMGPESALERQEPVLRAILRCAAAEFQAPESATPAPVIISEYVDITRGFCSEKHAPFTNSLLDKVARGLRCSLSHKK